MKRILLYVSFYAICVYQLLAIIFRGYEIINWSWIVVFIPMVVIGCIITIAVGLGLLGSFILNSQISLKEEEYYDSESDK